MEERRRPCARRRRYPQGGTRGRPARRGAQSLAMGRPPGHRRRRPPPPPPLRSRPDLRRQGSGVPGSTPDATNAYCTQTLADLPAAEPPCSLPGRGALQPLRVRLILFLLVVFFVVLGEDHSPAGIDAGPARPHGRRLRGSDGSGTRRRVAGPGLPLPDHGKLPARARHDCAVRLGLHRKERAPRRGAGGDVRERRRGHRRPELVLGNCDSSYLKIEVLAAVRTEGSLWCSA